MVFDDDTAYNAFDNIQAIDAVFSNRSGRKELWEENQSLYPLWREDKLARKERLV